jgi:hypothetical protein
VPTGDLAVIHGDQAIFDPSFPPATVAAPPGVISGSSADKCGGLVVCVEGDESTVVVTGAVYFTPSFPIPGAGTLTIESLNVDQKAVKATSNGRKVILKGTKFRARFQVSAPAQVTTPSGTTPDPNPIYSGTGSFVTTNTKLKAE